MTYSRWLSAAFEDVLIKDVVPMIDATYRTVPDRDHRALAGLSMGAMQAFGIGFDHLDTFAFLAGFSWITPTSTTFFMCRQAQHMNGKRGAAI